MKKFTSIIMAFMMFLVMSASNLCYVFAETVDSKEDTKENEAITLADTSSNDYAWQLVTDDNIDTGEYLIVANNKAMKNNDGNISSESVTISNNEISSVSNNSVWNITKNSSNYTVKNGSYYVNLTKSGNNRYCTLNTNSQNLEIFKARLLQAENAFSVSNEDYNTYLKDDFSATWRSNNIYFYKKVQKVNLNVEYYLDGEKVDSSSSKVVDGKAITISSPYENSEEYIFEKMIVNNGNESTEENYTININGDTTVKYYYKKAQLVSFTVNFYVNGNKQESDTISKDVKDGKTQTVEIPSKYDSYTFTKMTVNEKESTNIDKTIEINGDTVVNYYYASDSEADAYLPDGDLNGADQPEYPDQGAVRLNKTATSDIFNETGLTRVELGVTGVPIKKGIDVVIVLDTSGSMKWNVNGNTTNTESNRRIYIAKEAAKNFVNKILADNEDGSKSNNRVSLVTFNSSADMNCNLKNSNNKQVVLNAINDISNSPSGGTNYDDGVQKAYDVLNTNSSGRNKAVLFLSDGAPENGYNGKTGNNIKPNVDHTKSTALKNLGATMYTVGFGIQKSPSYDVLTQSACIGILRDHMASQDGTTANDTYYKNVTTAGALDTAFQNIATSIKKAGTEAKLSDTIGDAFELQMATPSHATSFDTSIKVLSYDLDANGNRTGTPEELEKITFNSTGTSATSSLKGNTNILSNGKINAEKFTYDIATKTFTWKIGDITSKEVVLSFAEYLTGSMSDQGVKKDNYPTNKGNATLTYKSYKDKNETKNIKSPVLPWGNASVKVEYYLVNNEGKPVNSAGVVVPEGFKVVVSTKDVDINLGQNTTINANDSKYMPSGYELLNENAYYTVTKPGQSGATQSSSKNDAADKGSTLIGGTEPYTTSTVSFGVKAKTSLTPDSIVLDYGKPITFNVLANDGLKNTTLTGIAKKDGTTLDTDLNTGVSSSHNNAFTDEATDEYGKAVKKNNTGDVTYTLSKYMSGIDKFYYEVTGTTTNSEGQKDDFYKYSSISVIPATSVYYEDNFAHNNDGTQTGGIVFDKGTVSAEGTSQTEETQSSDNTGYGNDASYDDDNQDSNGSSTKISGNGKTSATFTFKGTGFDIIGRTSTDTGKILVKVYRGTDTTGEVVNSVTLDTYYNQGTLYQIPVYNYTCPENGMYTVEIKVAKSQVFYLDGIRIYNPIDVNDNSEDASEAKNAYDEAKESNAQITEIRKIILASGKFNEDSSGVVFVDGNKEANISEYSSDGPNNEVYLANKQSVGVKLENLENVETIQVGAKSPNGKSTLVAGDKVKGFTKELNTATDMYYTIYSNDGKSENDFVTIENNSAYVVATNSGENTLSLTNIKITYKDKTTKTALFIADEDVAKYTRSLTLERTEEKIETSQPSDSNLNVNKAEFTSSSVKVNKEATLKVYTTEDVEKILIKDSNGNEVKPTKTSVTTKKSKGEVVEKVFTIKLKSTQTGKITYNVHGIGSDSNMTKEATSVNITVKRSSIFDTILSWFK